MDTSPHCLLLICSHYSQVDEIKDECSISCTQNTRLTTAVLLSKIYDSLGEDKDRLRISDIVDDHIKETLMRDSRAAQVIIEYSDCLKHFIIILTVYILTIIIDIH